ncbi:MAG: ribonuclease HI [Spirochaetaceae bacterium]|nr:ribonuclease HI [Spirochaetaceae bacterium]
MKKILWGILGAGNIANDFAQALKATDSCICYAVASRDTNRGKKFAEKWGFEKTYSTYEELLSDSAVQAVYIATPHMNHADLSIAALKAGKAVICEKPAAVNEKMLQQVYDCASQNNTFFMEAMWTKFHPCFLKAMEWIALGKIGELKAVYADFCISGSKDLSATYNTNRLFDLELAGGALLDVGIYPVTAALEAVAASVAKGQKNSLMPEQITVSCRKYESGVDVFDSIGLNFGHTIAHLSCSLDTECGEMFKSARFVGSQGVIEAPLFWMCQQIRLYSSNGELQEEYSNPFKVNGYEYEIEEFCRCLNEEEKDNSVIQTPMHTHGQSLRVIKTLDMIRSQINLVYPFEATDYNIKKETGVLKESGAMHQMELELFEQQIVVYTDGGCSGNPGPGGWGCVILADGLQYTASGGEPNTTNNRMELCAAIAALSAIDQNQNWRTRSVVVIIDSQYVRNGITSWIKAWKKNNWHNAEKQPVKNRDLWEVLDDLNSKLDVTWQWIKGHSGIYYNELCDQLATQEAEKYSR